VPLPKGDRMADHIISLLACCLMVCGPMAAISGAGAAEERERNLLPNGNFAEGMKEWLPFWTRDPGASRSAIESAAAHSPWALITHTGEKDWSFCHTLRLAVQPGEIYELSAAIHLEGKGSASLGVVTRDTAGDVLNWDHGGRHIVESKASQEICARFVVPPAAATIQPRLMGYGPSNVRLANVILRRAGTVAELRNKDLPATVSAQNGRLDLTVRTADATFEIRDRASGISWTQLADDVPLTVLSAQSVAGGIDLRLLDPVALRELAANVRLANDRPEVTVSLRSKGEMRTPLRWPAPFVTAGGQTLILPLNEGISYPVDDESLREMNYSVCLYGGHGLCMPWYGAMNPSGGGWMALVETPDDAVVHIPRRDGLFVVAPEWHAQRGQFGPERVIRYAFFDRGGYVAMAKRYRDYAKETGLFRTLAEKRKAVPAVDLLVGAVNVWCWEKDAPAFCREMQALGIGRILWSNARPPEELKALNEMGVLTSRYDIYQDTMNPENFPKLRWVHGDWTTDAWKNDDLMVGENGDWVRGWEVETREGPMIPCGVLCDRQAVDYAKKRIPAELATHPYACRFIDTTTASPWRECYNPKHPMTRTESRLSKMQLLRYVSEGCGLVCGSETGHDAAVPYVHYFEGMLSLGPFRVPDAGRDMMKVWDNIPDDVAKFQTGHGYRIPLWELVYHDCVVAQWYWGDYNNKLPALWDRRDLWNALYGTPPMFMFDRNRWESNRARFAKSYAASVPIARATGYVEMLSHEWLTADHAVQRTRFANGVTVTANFGNAPWKQPNGISIPPLGCNAEGIQPVPEQSGK
jgi:hypothetical protein